MDCVGTYSTHYRLSIQFSTDAGVTWNDFRIDDDNDDDDDHDDDDHDDDDDDDADGVDDGSDDEDDNGANNGVGKLDLVIFLIIWKYSFHCPM